MILPDSKTYGQSFVLYVLANTDEPLTASAIGSLNENARASGAVGKALKKLFRDEIARIDGNIEGILTRLGQQGESVARLDLLVEEMKEMNQQLEHIKIRLNTLEGRIE